MIEFYSGWCHPNANHKKGEIYHYYRLHRTTSLCGKRDRDSSFTYQQFDWLGNTRICPDCLEIYQKDRTKSGSAKEPINDTPHYVHKTVCKDCKMPVIFLSNDPVADKNKTRIHVGCPVLIKVRKCIKT